MIASPRDRAKVLRFAAALTSDRENVAAVAVNASPLLAFLEAAGSPADLRLRLRAMNARYWDTIHAIPDDNPDRFLAEARTLYAFMTAGGAECAS